MPENNEPTSSDVNIPSRLEFTKRQFLKTLTQVPSLALTGGTVAAGAAGVNYGINKLKGLEPTAIEQQFFTEISSAMDQARKTHQAAKVSFGDFTFTIQLTKDIKIAPSR